MPTGPASVLEGKKNGGQPALLVVTQRLVVRAGGERGRHRLHVTHRVIHPTATKYHCVGAGVYEALGEGAQVGIVAASKRAVSP